MGLPRKALPRIEALVAQFPRFLSIFIDDPAFGRFGQLEYHLAAINRRRAHTSVASALADNQFLKSLYSTLQAWGIGARASELRLYEEFVQSLRSKRDDLARLEEFKIDQPDLDADQLGRRVWQVIETLPIVRNNTSIVSGSKALHHLLPDLVVPFDRQYTQRFFGWHNPQVQYGEQRCFTEAFSAFADIARRVQPEQYVNHGWNSSRTKVLDNALVGFVRSGEMDER